jgi:hypothetical protein
MLHDTHARYASAVCNARSLQLLMHVWRWPQPGYIDHVCPRQQQQQPEATGMALYACTQYNNSIVAGLKGKLRWHCHLRHATMLLLGATCCIASRLRLVQA